MTTGRKEFTRYSSDQLAKNEGLSPSLRFNLATTSACRTTYNVTNKQTACVAIRGALRDLEEGFAFCVCVRMHLICNTVDCEKRNHAPSQVTMFQKDSDLTAALHQSS